MSELEGHVRTSLERRGKPWRILLSLAAHLLLGSVLLVAVIPDDVAGGEGESVKMIPLADLDVEQATATVSVLPDEFSSMDTILNLCRSGLPKEYFPDAEDISEGLKKWCGMLEGLAKKHVSPPSHRIQEGAYVISVPLKKPQDGVQAVRWTSKNLDEAIAFVDLLQKGTLKAVTIYTSDPWKSDGRLRCSECPIKDLVFHAAGIRDQLKFLEEKSN